MKTMTTAELADTLADLANELRRSWNHDEQDPENVITVEQSLTLAATMLAVDPRKVTPIHRRWAD